MLICSKNLLRHRCNEMLIRLHAVELLVCLAVTVILIISFKTAAANRWNDFHTLPRQANNSGSQRQNGKNPFVVCETEACHRISKLMKNLMVPEADPCHSFYDYAAGAILDPVRRPWLISNFPRVGIWLVQSVFPLVTFGEHNRNEPLFKKEIGTNQIIGKF